MRFLNKVVFINSATIRYAEVMVDGNVHLIGTQGVGKSTLLRTVLFFYNADTLKLGISKEKKSFAEYYFPYRNSFLIYEVMRESGPFCIIAFKSQGKVCFRFMDAAYHRDYFVDADGRAFEKWEDNRQVLDTQRIDHTRKVDRYEEYRDILYGNNEVGKKEFAKYALLQSKQYQNIPRTIQNVFLNSKLEAEFIKQTIIMSLNEEDLSIDLQSYTHHLKNFEQQLNDIHLYKQPHIMKQAENVVKNHLAIKYLESEKNRFAQQLAWSAAQLQRMAPKLLDKKEKTEAEKAGWQEKIESTSQRYQNKYGKITGEISVLDSELKKAREKADMYARHQIDQIIERSGKEKELGADQQKLEKEKQLLTFHFSEISLKYESLQQALDQAYRSFEQDKKEEQMAMRELAASEREDAADWLLKAQSAVKQLNAQAIEQARQALEQHQQHLNQEKLKKATLTHQRFFEKELMDAAEEVTIYELAIRKNTNDLDHFKNQSITLQKQWELDETATKQQTERRQEKLQDEITSLQQQLQSVEYKLQTNEQAFYGWLNKNKPGWEDTIGKVVNEQLLFNSDLEPRAIADLKDIPNFFGVTISINDLPVQVKTVAEYQKELKQFEDVIAARQAELQTLQGGQSQQLEKLKKKYQPLIKDAKDSLLELNYKQEQDTLQLRQSVVQQKDWEVRSQNARKQAMSDLDAAIAAASEMVAHSLQLFQQTEDELLKQLKVKEREHAKKIASIEQDGMQKMSIINESLRHHKTTWEQEKQQLKIQLQHELSGKGADTGRLEILDQQLEELEAELKFIEDNRVLVIEYRKDKKEWIDKADTFKSQKSILEKQLTIEEEKYRQQKEGISIHLRETEGLLQQLNQQLNLLEEDSKAFIRFQQTDPYLSINSAYTEEKETYKNDKSCKVLIEEVNRCYYTSIKRLDDLKETANKFLGNFSVQNIFSFPSALNDKHAYQQFAEDLNEFISNSKIEEFERRVNERFANVIKLVGKETGDLMSKAGDIQKVISNINKDFDNKNFVGAIRKIELRIDESANKVVQLLTQIKKFNDEHSFDIGGLNLFSSTDQESKNKKAVDLLKQLGKAINEYRRDTIALSDSFELKFRVEENQNDTGWVEKLSNVGSEGTDVLVKAMINIMLLNVFKEGASKRFKEFRLHCMMDEIGKLHPNNIKGILQFANDRNILLINGSPTETNALNYRHIYKLEKDDNRNTKIKRIITQLSKV